MDMTLELATNSNKGGVNKFCSDQRLPKLLAGTTLVYTYPKGTFSLLLSVHATEVSFNQQMLPMFVAGDIWQTWHVKPD